MGTNKIVHNTQLTTHTSLSSPSSLPLPLSLRALLRLPPLLRVLRVLTAAFLPFLPSTYAKEQAGNIANKVTRRVIGAWGFDIQSISQQIERCRTKTNDICSKLQTNKSRKKKTVTITTNATQHNKPSCQPCRGHHSSPQEVHWPRPRHPAHVSRSPPPRPSRTNHRHHLWCEGECMEREEQWW